MILQHRLASQSPKISRAEGTYAVIIVPTRELCIQIQDVAVGSRTRQQRRDRSLGPCFCVRCSPPFPSSPRCQLLLLRRFVWLVSSVLIGGEHRGHEKARLRKGVTIVVATPGRLQVGGWRGISAQNWVTFVSFTSSTASSSFQGGPECRTTIRPFPHNFRPHPRITWSTPPASRRPS